MRHNASRYLLSLSLALCAAMPASADSPALANSSASAPALIIERGSLARQQVVALGRDVAVDGEALADVAAINGSARVSGSIAGDLLVLGGHAHLDPTARIAGDVFVVGGTLDAAPGATIGGRAVSYSTVSSAWLTLLEGPSLGLSSSSPLILGAKLALLAAWAALVLLLFAASGRELLSTSEAVRREPFHCFVVGLTGVLALVLTALFFSAVAALLIGVPLLVLVVILALMLKFWGMVAVFHALGGWLLNRFSGRRLLPLHAACLGLLALGLLKFLPYVGLIGWTVATLLGVGATLVTKFGRREPWFVRSVASDGSY
ncbi:MAG: polymer-forming cytoskeletal protein [Acidobacteriota bacterium]